MRRLVASAQRGLITEPANRISPPRQKSRGGMLSFHFCNCGPGAQSPEVSLAGFNLLQVDRWTKRYDRVGIGREVSISGCSFVTSSDTNLFTTEYNPERL
jgi:hypothetical protein